MKIEAHSRTEHSTPSKYSKKHILEPKKFEKSNNRWNQFASALNEIHKRALDGPLLDVGCGIGYFVYSGLKRGFNIWGVDASESKVRRFRKLIHFTASPENWNKNCVVGNGQNLPFKSNRFPAISSWYVLEHIKNLSGVLKELVRITQPEGLIMLKAQDARNCWEGHYKIPWIPFLSDNLAKVWVEEFGKPFEKRNEVYDITQPQVAAMLETFGCQIVAKASPPKTLIRQHWQIHTEKEVRKTARKIKALLENKQWFQQPERLFIIAVKK
jgi:ubiquinone/menaquinone biosynthesis C-methylase UbiE